VESSLRVTICRILSNVILVKSYCSHHQLKQGPFLNARIGWMLDAFSGHQICVPYITKLV